MGADLDDTTAPTVFAALRDRREQAKAELFTDLKIPRYDPPIYVRFKPVPQARIDGMNKAAEKSKAKDATVAANAAILADATIGVFEVIDDQKVSINPSDREGEWPRFDSDLAELFEVRATKAADVVREVYMTDGDIIATVTQLGVWSGFNLDDIQADFEGN